MGRSTKKTRKVYNVATSKQCKWKKKRVVVGRKKERITSRKPA